MVVDLGGRALHVETGGSPPPHWLLLHGLADTLEIWRKVAPGLERRGHAVLVDQRAHGRSSALSGPVRRAELAADIVTLLDRLAIDEAIVVGHSMGGIVAMTTALIAPERIAALVLLGTASQVSARAAAWYEKIAEAAENDGIDGLRRAIFGASSDRAIEGDARGMAAITRALASLHESPLTPALRDVRCPTLLLVGDRDPMGPAASEIIQRAIPGSTLEVIPGGHWLHVEAPERVLESIARFAASAGIG
jgi:pimeloyl-ACP methyl ester carboxylesterase